MGEREEDGRLLAVRAASWVGAVLSALQVEQLERYARWLETEAIPAGVLGPTEAPRLWARHIADSLVFARGWGQIDVHTLLDIGTGAGLPGIPLAVAFPDLRVTLLDRSSTRARLVARAMRIVGLDNALVSTDQASTHEGVYDVVVSRATLRLDEAVRAVARLAPDGIGVVALSRRAAPHPARLRRVEEEHRAKVAVIKVPPHLLDSPAWLLRITPPCSAR